MGRVILGLALSLTVSVSGSVAAGDWFGAPAAVELQSVEVRRVATNEALREVCGPEAGSTAIACFMKQSREEGRCVVYLGPEAGNCILRHELSHCAGWNHWGENSSCGVPTK